MSVSMWLIQTLIFTSVILSIECRASYRDRIPNGYNVPNPCKPGSTWDGVGHKIPGGGGTRNPFGELFEKHKEWNEEVCRADSDNDTLTNGFELGDPDCKWTPGKNPDRTEYITHPGICTPWNSADCLVVNKWAEDLCTDEDFKCDALNELDIQNMTIKLKTSPVPPKETTYMCQMFDVPEGDFHMVAVTPELDNLNVIHHMLIFGCDPSKTDSEFSRQLDTAYECGMVPDRYCQELISVWSFGMKGDCIHKNAGFRLGQNGYKRLAIELHWNNPDKVADYTDGSGLRLYFTKNFRQYDAGILVVGATDMLIPPQETDVKIRGICPAKCTSQYISDTVMVTAVMNHMHYLGRSQRIEVHRGGDVITFSNDVRYEYDNPILHRYEVPKELKPGDEIDTFCTYNTMSKNVTTFYGDATSDEMCFGFITYYPKENFNAPFCTSDNEIGDCEYYPRSPENLIRGCPFYAIMADPYNSSLTEGFNLLKENCEAFGRCLKECITVVKELRKHPCLRAPVDYLFRQTLTWSWNSHKELLMEFFGRLDSCNVELAKEEIPPCTCTSTTECNCDTTPRYTVCRGSAIETSSFLMFSVLIFKLFSSYFLYE